MKTREFRHEVMRLSWQFVRRNGFSRSESLKLAWANLLLRGKLKQGVVCFRFKRVDGRVRQAFGTLSTHLMPEVKRTGRKVTTDTVQVYYDTVCGEFRSFRKANLMSVAFTIALD